jgi:DNA-binding CsgD family transcriptional regulator
VGGTSYAALVTSVDTAISGLTVTGQNRHTAVVARARLASPVTAEQGRWTAVDLRDATWTHPARALQLIAGTISRSRCSSSVDGRFSVETELCLVESPKRPFTGIMNSAGCGEPPTEPAPDQDTLPLREEIVVSWFRSARSGVQPDRFGVPYDEIDLESDLLLAARPVLERIDEDLVGTGNGLVLTDVSGHILDRRAPDKRLRAWLDDVELAPGFYYDEGHAGTNAIGTALVVERPFLVDGGEHFAEVLTRLVTAAVPVHQPRTGQVLGVVGLSAGVEDANRLMLPFANRAASEIGQRLVDDVTQQDRVLYTQFAAARRRTRDPLVAVSERTMLVNTIAAPGLDPRDRELLWDWASRALTDRTAVPGPVTLHSGTWTVKRLLWVRDGGIVIGAILRLEAPVTAEKDRALRSGPLGSGDRPRFGWASVTATEMRVAELVARGMTNREIANELYLSPHTVSFHIRQMFRKLEISSRVELTRLLVEGHADLRTT